MTFLEDGCRSESTWERIRKGKSNEKNLLDKLLIARAVGPGLLCGTVPGAVLCREQRMAFGVGLSPRSFIFSAVS